MLDSKAVAAVQEVNPGIFSLCIRADFEPELNIYSFQRLKKFTSEQEAKQYYIKTFPLGRLVPFHNLTDAE